MAPTLTFRGAVASPADADCVRVCGLPAGASGIREDMLVPIDLEKHNLTIVLDRDREVAFRTQEEDLAFFVEVKFCTEAVKDLFNGRCGCAGDLEAGPQVRPESFGWRRTWLSQDLLSAIVRCALLTALFSPRRFKSAIKRSLGGHLPHPHLYV